MNPLQSKPSGSPALKLARRVSYVTDTVAPEPPASGELAGEFEALREREANLRAYEAKLRAWQEQLDAAARAPGFVPPPTSASLTRSPFAGTQNSFTGSRNPFGAGSDQEIHDAWEKFHRARALLQAEQNQLRDERMTFRDREADLQRREAELQAREAIVVERERQLEAAHAAEAEKPQSAVRRLTQAPFLAARSVFGASR
ncbi:hypothetical protein [Opitutus terrae]|uniref:Uncharacterized protein n=1 Tax=Opitutus terrae (strain DSM 11246 / JCM 15787 / PB90-1) TaxID=452637 RepID=B1ZTM9_OPITP|nr:hypothetical protein [Opitutus terrae]ACB74815.1 hypothetical protein Oter_1531 [Opitutus terrae PB90-1]